jgi:hypothetical protein
MGSLGFFSDNSSRGLLSLPEPGIYPGGRRPVCRAGTLITFWESQTPERPNELSRPAMVWFFFSFFFGLNIKFHATLSSGRRNDTCGQTDGYDVTSKRFLPL